MTWICWQTMALGMLIVPLNNSDIEDNGACSQRWFNESQFRFALFSEIFERIHLLKDQWRRQFKLWIPHFSNLAWCRMYWAWSTSVNGVVLQIIANRTRSHWVTSTLERRNRGKEKILQYDDLAKSEVVWTWSIGRAVGQICPLSLWGTITIIAKVPSYC